MRTVLAPFPTAQVERGVEPDVLCYAAATRCCGITGDWATAVRLLETALRRGLFPNRKTIQVPLQQRSDDFIPHSEAIKLREGVSVMCCRPTGHAWPCMRGCSGSVFIYIEANTLTATHRNSSCHMRCQPSFQQRTAVTCMFLSLQR